MNFKHPVHFKDFEKLFSVYKSQPITNILPHSKKNQKITHKF
jgi:hypothetical protein